MCDDFDAAWIPSLPFPSFYAHSPKADQADRSVPLTDLHTFFNLEQDRRWERPEE